MNKTMTLAGALALALLAGCGGGGDGEGDAMAGAREVPASALVSARAYAEFAGSQKADDRADPLEVDRVVPPTSETDEPVEID